MGETQAEDNSQCYYCWLFIIICISTASAIVLLIFFFTWGYYGFNDSSALTFANCTNNYYIAKFGDQNLVNKVVTISALVAVLAGVTSTIVALSWLVKKCKQLDSPSVCCKCFLYFAISLACLTSIVPAGYYLTFQIQGNQCTKIVTDEIQLTILLALSVATLALVLLVWLSLLCLKRQDRESKYRQLSSHLTEPNREQTSKYKLPEDHKKYFSKPRQNRQVGQPGSPFPKRKEYSSNQRQQTRQNIFNPRPRDDEFYRPRFIQRQSYENPVLNLHPDLNINNDKQYEYGKMLHARKVSYKDFLLQDERALREEEKKHYSNFDQGRPVMRNDRYRDSPRNYRGRGNQRRNNQRDYEDDDRDYEDRLRRNRREYVDNNRNRSKSRNRRGSPYHDDRRDERFDDSPPRRRPSPPRSIRQQAILRALTKP